MSTHDCPHCDSLARLSAYEWLTKQLLLHLTKGNAPGHDAFLAAVQNLHDRLTGSDPSDSPDRPFPALLPFPDHSLDEFIDVLADHLPKPRVGPSP